MDRDVVFPQAAMGKSTPLFVPVVAPAAERGQSKRAISTASRRSVVTLSPGFFGMSDGATPKKDRRHASTSEQRRTQFVDGDSHRVNHRRAVSLASGVTSCAASTSSRNENLSRAPAAT